ncbi:MAG TPA: ABC transporter ATP-binding protein [Eubacteriales bacterium]|nr:ABC transporter ATP-binding protein [Clostridia bacterium]HRV72547.1 ABC transporter ATP-binding protein [Eubacteriales bacterium]
MEHDVKRNDTHTAEAPLLQVKDLKVQFLLKAPMFTERRILKAVDGVSFNLDRGEILSLVGESGSGKTTTGKAILKLIPSAGGQVLFDGKPIGISAEELRRFRLGAQMIYQDPYQSLNPRQYIVDIVGEPLDVNHITHDLKDRGARIKAALENAGLIPAEDYFYRYPYELSGGQRQRVAIAGSLILGPKFIVADEPVSMLDASIRTGIIKLMLEQRDRNGIAYLFITHDLSLAWLISDSIAIMYLGKLMEIGSADAIIKHGLHPYTKALLDIMPVPGKTRHEKRNILEGETPNAAAKISGCKFSSRCKYRCDRCTEDEPALVEVEKGHKVACHRAGEI